MTMRHLTIGLGLISQGDTYVLQLRGDNPAIGAAGLIGAFGGKIEPGETPLEAVCRELSEETSLAELMHEDLQHVGVVEVISDHQMEPITVHATVFELALDTAIDVSAKEGTLVRLTKDEILQNRDQLTPATRAYFEMLM